MRRHDRRDPAAFEDVLINAFALFEFVFRHLVLGLAVAADVITAGEGGDDNGAGAGQFQVGRAFGAGEPGVGYHHACGRLGIVGSAAAGVGKAQVDFWQFLDLAEVKLAGQAVASGGGEEELHPVVRHHPEHAHVAGAEAAHPLIELACLARGQNPPVHHHHGALANGLGRRRSAHRVEQILRPIRAGPGGWPLRADDDYRLVRTHGEVKKEGGLFQPVGAVSHHHAGEILALVEQRLDPAGQGDPHRWRDERAGQIGELQALHLRVLFKPRDRGHDLLRAEAPGAIFGRIIGIILHPGDGPAGSDDQHLRERLSRRVGRIFNRCGRQGRCQQGDDQHGQT